VGVVLPDTLSPPNTGRGIPTFGGHT
jgi:hypothetical protein